MFENILQVHLYVRGVAGGGGGRRADRPADPGGRAGGRHDVPGTVHHGHPAEAHRLAPVDLRAVPTEPQQVHPGAEGVVHPVPALHVHDR